MTDDQLIKAGRAWMAAVADGNLTGALAAMRAVLGVPAPTQGVYLAVDERGRIRAWAGQGYTLPTAAPNTPIGPFVLTGAAVPAAPAPAAVPAVRMRDITALCEEVTRLRAELAEAQKLARDDFDLRAEQRDERDRLRADFAALQHALVGDTGASAIETAHRLRAAPAQAGASAAPQWECKAGGLKPLTDAQYQVQPPNIQRHYTRIAPAQREPLSDDQLWSIANALPQQPWGIGSRWTDVVAFVRAAEAAHGITAPTTQEQQ